MAILKNIKLGRAGYESIFELNPSGVQYTPTRIEDLAHGLDGSGIDVNLSRNRPVLQINGNYITPAQQNQFLSLLHIDYEPLVFEPMDFNGNNVWESWQERVIPINDKQFFLPATSFTDAAKWKQLNGSYEVIRPVSLWQFMNRVHGREGDIGVNLFGANPGIWGVILKEDFNLLPTGLLSAAGTNYLVVNGNGTTRDAFVSTASPIEGAKDCLITSDGSGLNVLVRIQNGTLWNPADPYYQRGYQVQHRYDATWNMQLLGTTVGNNLSVYVDSDISGANPPWAIGLDVTSPTTATYSFVVDGTFVITGATLTNPFLNHVYRVNYDGTNLQLWIDAVKVYDQPHVLSWWVEWAFAARGWATEDVVKFDVVSITDGSAGYDPSTGLVTFTGGGPGPLTAGRPYWFTYQYNAMLVEMSAIPLTVEGGWVGFSRYNFKLEGI